MNEASLRQRLVTMGARLYERGLSPGTSGNLSVRMQHGWLTTPTNVCLGDLEAETLPLLDWNGNHLSGDKPSKEANFHLAYYRHRPRAHAIVHLHSTYCAAVSCLDGLDPDDVLPPLTPYYVMRIGRLPRVDYYRPGDQRLGEAVARLAPEYSAVLLANHGPIVSGSDLDRAVAAAEELEETAKLFLLLQDKPYRTLNDAQIDQLRSAS